MDGRYSAERPDQGGGGSSDWLLISRASLTPPPPPPALPLSARRLQVTPKGSWCPRLKQFHTFTPTTGPPIQHLSPDQLTGMQLGRAFPLSFPSTFLHSGCSTSNEFFFSSQRVVKEEGEAQRTNIEFEDTRVRKTERERKQDRLLGIDIEVSKGTRSYSLAWKASRSGRSPLRRIRAEDGGKLKALFKISRLSGPVWGGGGGETRGGRSA